MFLRWLYSSLCLLLVCHRIALAVSDDEMAALQDFYYATSGDHWYAGGFGAEVPWDFSGAFAYHIMQLLIFKIGIFTLISLFLGAY